MNPAQPPRRAGALHGWHWFTGALDIVRHQPATFLGMGLCVACVYSLLPFVGPLAVLIMGPAALAGICIAARTSAHKQAPAFEQMFALLVEPTRRREALKLCIPLILGKLTAVMILGFALANQLARQGIKVTALQGDREKLMGLLLGDAMHPWLLAALAVIVLAWTFTLLAIPRVAFSREPAFTAMGESFRLVWHHFSAWLVAALALLALVLAVSMVLLATRFLLLVQLGFFTTLYAVLGPMMYVAWHDLGSQPADADSDNPPPPPSSPPSPPGVFEA